MFKRYITLLIFILLCFHLNAQEIERTGGYARVVSMGNNPYLVDPEGIKYNPAWGSVYYDFIWGDIGANAAPGPGTNFTNTGAGQFAGFNFRLNDELTLGALLTRKDFNSFSIARIDPLNIVGTLNASGLTPAGIPLDNNLEVFASYEIGKLTFGAGVAYAASSNENNPAEGGSSESTVKQLGINAGILAHFTDDILLDAGASFVLPSAKFTPPKGNGIDISQTFIAVNARAFLRISEKVRLIPGVTFLTGSGTADIDTTSGELPSVNLIAVGFGIEYQVDDFLLVGGPAFASASTTQPSITNVQPELKTSNSIFPLWNIGVEWTALDWLIARMGYTAATGNTTNQTKATPTTVNEVTSTIYQPLGINAGIGFRFGSFSFDATVNTDALRQGLNLIGGGGATFAYISTSYAF